MLPGRLLAKSDPWRSSVALRRAMARRAPPLVAAPFRAKWHRAKAALLTRRGCSRGGSQAGQDQRSNKRTPAIALGQGADAELHRPHTILVRDLRKRNHAS